MPELQPGETILNTYKIKRLLGQGAFGEVYLAQHMQLNVDRAIKILKRESLGVGSTIYSQARERFLTEARLGAQLKTPNLVEVYDFQDSREMLLLVMEYCPGGNLLEWSSRQKQGKKAPTLQTVLTTLVSVASGLSALHTRDIVHRDLKPSNILFDENQNAKVADLGLAQTPGGLSQRSVLGSQGLQHPGTPAYMSPEQQNSNDYLSPASDVYALGLVIFELLTGKNYKNQRPGTSAASLRVGTPAWLDQLLMRMLEKEPEKRPWNGREVLAEIQKGMAGAEKARADKIEHQQLLEVGRKSAAEDAQPAAAEQKTAAPIRLEYPKNEDRPSPGKGWKWAAGLAGGGSLFLLGGLFLVILVVLILNNLPAFFGAAPTPGPVPALAVVPGTAVETNPQAGPAARVITTPKPLAPATATQIPKALGIGSTQVSPQDGMPLVYVPAGEFQMGSTEAQYQSLVAACVNSGINRPACEWIKHETPAHTVYLDAFWIDKTQLTNARYNQCVSAGSCKPSRCNDTNFSGNLQPVVCVDWSQADAYCKWAGRSLPTEAQWEKAARGPDGRTYPWGNQPPDKNLLNFNDNIGKTTNVGSYPAGASPYGALDMEGNVMEWTADWYDASYYSHSPGRNPLGPAAGHDRVSRGGWYSVVGDTRSAERGDSDPTGWSITLGFRCAASHQP